jgi:acyl carrier protein
MTELGLDEQVRAFVAETVGRSQGEILPTTALQNDLGLDGDDAHEFMIEFVKRFDVDMSGFEFLGHFGSEGMWPWQFPRFLWNVICRIRGDGQREIPGLKTIHVADLYRAAETKKWKSVAAG